ncbi:tail_fiber protein [Hexamita inflata]|uniref:Tail fiber protein n=1 Tax=Hexamita inflata TaxID=28002 RepID=A0AA86TP30_9EUKA|nr:tail fiber protein [Hexamita inflata]
MYQYLITLQVHILFIATEFAGQFVHVLFPDEQNYKFVLQAQLFVMLFGVDPVGHAKQVITFPITLTVYDMELQEQMLFTTVEPVGQAVQLFPDGLQQKLFLQTQDVQYAFISETPPGHQMQVKTPDEFEVRYESELHAHKLSAMFVLAPHAVQVLFDDEQKLIPLQTQVYVRLFGTEFAGHRKHVRTPEVFKVRYELALQAHKLFETTVLSPQYVHEQVAAMQKQFPLHTHVFEVLSETELTGHVKQVRTPETLLVQYELESQTQTLLKTVELAPQAVQVLFEAEQKLFPEQLQIVQPASGAEPAGHLVQVATPSTFETWYESELQEHPTPLTAELARQATHPLLEMLQNQLAGQGEHELLPGTQKLLRGQAWQVFEAEMYWKQVLQTQTFEVTTELAGHAVHELSEDLQKLFPEQSQVLVLLLELDPTGQVKQVRDPETLFVWYELASQTQTLLETVELGPQAVQVLFEEEQKLFPEQSQVLVLLLELDPTGQVKQVRDPETLFVQYELASQTQTLLETVELAPQAVQVLFEEEQKKFPEQSQVLVLLFETDPTGQVKQVRDPETLFVQYELASQTQTLLETVELAPQAVQVLFEEEQKKFPVQSQVLVLLLELDPTGQVKQVRDPETLFVWQELESQTQTLLETVELGPQAVQVLFEEEQKKFPEQSQVLVLLFETDPTGQVKQVRDPETLFVQYELASQTQTLLETVELAPQAVQVLFEEEQKKFPVQSQVLVLLLELDPTGQVKQVRDPETLFVQYELASQTQTLLETVELAPQAVQVLFEEEQKKFPVQSQVLVLLLELDPTGQVKQVRDPETLFVQYELASQTQTLLETVELAPQAVQVLFEEEQKKFPVQSQVLVLLLELDPTGQVKQVRDPETLFVQYELASQTQTLLETVELAPQAVQVLFEEEQKKFPVQSQVLVLLLELDPTGQVKQVRDPETLFVWQELESQTQTLLETVELAPQAVQVLFEEEQKKFPVQSQVLVLLLELDPTGQVKQVRDPETLFVQYELASQTQTLLETVELAPQAVQVLFEEEQKKFPVQSQVLVLLLELDPTGQVKQVRDPETLFVWQELESQTQTLLETVELGPQAVQVLFEEEQKKFPEQSQVLVLLLELDPTGQVKQVRDPETLFVWQELASQTQTLLETVELGPQAVQVLFEEEQKKFPEQSQVLVLLLELDPTGQVKQVRDPETLFVWQELASQTQTLLETVELAPQAVQVLFEEEQKKFPVQSQVLVLLLELDPTGQVKQVRDPETLFVWQELESQTQTLLETVELAPQAVQVLFEEEQKKFPVQSQVLVLLFETDPTGQVKQVRDPETLFVQYELESQTQTLLETVELAPQAVQVLIEAVSSTIAGRLTSIRS